MFEKRTFLVGPAEDSVRLGRELKGTSGENALVRLEVDGVGVKYGEEAEVDLDWDFLVDGDGLAAGEYVRACVRRGFIIISC